MPLPWIAMLLDPTTIHPSDPVVSIVCAWNDVAQDELSLTANKSQLAMQEPTARSGAGATMNDD
eukprot:4719376-Amphidinium_carterae.1